MTAKKQSSKSPGPRNPKLEPFESEIMELHLQGKKVTEIQNWLKSEKGIATAYSNLHAFIHRRAEKFSETSGTAVILHFMRLKPEIRKEVLQILLMLMHKESNVPPQKSVRKHEQVAPASAAKPVLEDYMKIQPDDPPAIVRLKKLATIDSTELEQFEEELKAKKSKL
jgi:hypothetical protein